MPRERIDCKKPEPDPVRYLECRWCGRPVRWTYRGKLVHRRGYRRMHPDPRKEKSDG